MVLVQKYTLLLTLLRSPTRPDNYTDRVVHDIHYAFGHYLSDNNNMNNTNNSNTSNNNNMKNWIVDINQFYIKLCNTINYDAN
eukprot:UN08844